MRILAFLINKNSIETMGINTIDQLNDLKIAKVFLTRYINQNKVSITNMKKKHTVKVHTVSKTSFLVY